MSDMLKRITDKPNLLDSINTIVKKEIDEGNIPTDAKLVGVGIVDNEGLKLIGMVSLHESDKKSLKIKAIFEHDWDGNDSVAGKVIFTSR